MKRAKAKKPKTTPASTKRTKPKPAAAKPRASAVKTRAAKKPAARADLGAPIDGFFAKQPSQLRPILDALRKLVEAAAPDAASSIKWGMPFYSVGGTMMCALGAHKSHVNLILSGSPGAFPDPEGRLSGAGKTGRHLKLTAVDEIPTKAVRSWLAIAAGLAREKR